MRQKLQEQTGRHARLILRARKQYPQLHEQKHRPCCGHCHNCHEYACKDFYSCPGHCCGQCPQYCGHAEITCLNDDKEKNIPNRQHTLPAMQSQQPSRMCLQAVLPASMQTSSIQDSVQDSMQASMQPSMKPSRQAPLDTSPHAIPDKDLVPLPAYFPAHLPSYLVQPLSCLCLAIFLLVPGIASASYEEHLAGEILSRQAVAPAAASLQPEKPLVSDKPLVSEKPLVPGKDSRPLAQNAARQAGLEEQGQPNPVRTGMNGSNVPFKRALTLLIPPGWTCTGTLPEKQGPAVSWKKGENWHEVLAKACVQNNVHMSLNWQDKSITIHEAAGAMPASGAGSASGSDMEAGSSKVSPARETKPGDPGIISLAPLPDKPEAKAADGSSSTAPDSTGSSNALPNAAQDRKGEAQAKETDSVRDAIACAQKESSASRTGTASAKKESPGASALRSGATDPARPDKPSEKTSGRPSERHPGKPAASHSGKPSGLSSASLPGNAQSGNAQAAQAQPAGSAMPAAAPSAAPSVESPAWPSATPPAAPAEYWQIGPGSLRLQLGSWAQRKGTALVWKPDTDLDLETGACFEGNFEEAVKTLFEGLKATGSPYTARLYKGNNVLIVEDR